MLSEVCLVGLMCTSIHLVLYVGVGGVYYLFPSIRGWVGTQLFVLQAGMNSHWILFPSFN